MNIRFFTSIALALALFIMLMTIDTEQHEQSAVVSGMCEIKVSNNKMSIAPVQGKQCTILQMTASKEIGDET